MKASPVLEDGGARLAISVIEDITEIKQAEEAQRFLAETSRALARLASRSRRRCPEVARLVAAHARRRVRDPPARGGRAARRSPTRRPPPRTSRAAAAAVVGEPALAVPIRGATDRGPQRLPRLGRATSRSPRTSALRVGAAVDNARLYRTRAAIAQTLQQSLLPPELPEIPGVETAAHYRPAGEGIEVGGDFYDVFPTGEREWFAVIGDVCGKGAEAAAVTAIARYTIRAAVMRHRSPAGILRWLNAAMLRQRAGRFVTLALRAARARRRRRVTVDRRQRRAPARRGSCARPGWSRSSACPGRCSASSPRSSVDDRSARLAPGDALVLYTDGLTEVTRAARVDAAQLDAAVAGARRRDAQGIVDHLAAQADAEAEGPPRDDLALLALRVQPLL